jgi:ribonuclease P protein component
MSKYRFPKSSRLTSKSDFRAVIEHKSFSRDNLMTVYIAPNSTGKIRFAASINSKIAPAAVRNRLKRLAREAFRLNQNELADGFDYLAIYSPMLSKRDCSDIKKIALSDVKQSFIELAGQAYKHFEKRPNKYDKRPNKGNGCSCNQTLPGRSRTVSRRPVQVRTELQPIRYRGGQAVRHNQRFLYGGKKNPQVPSFRLKWF